MQGAQDVLREPVGEAHGLAFAKLAAMVVLGCCALLASLLPALLTRRCSTNPRFLDYLLRFGGGILLATTFLHLLPEVREGLEESGSSWAERLPVQLPELLMCAGFFIMYWFEEVAHRLLGHHADPEKTALTDHRGDLKKAWLEGTPLRAVLITLAISVHQVFEGLAVGLESQPGKVWILTGAILAHKVVIAVCIGAEAARSPPCALGTLVGLFSVATPLGVALGLLVSSESSLGLIPVLLQGLAAGTLLFVVFFEVLQRSNDGPHFDHFLVTATGFCLMLFLLCVLES